jgi:hypothetical protein
MLYVIGPSMAAIARLLPTMRERIEAVIKREGAFIVPKSVGFFTVAAPS